MKEGLRSGSISVKAEKKVLAEREDEKKSCFVFNVEKSSKEDSSGFEYGNEVMEREKRDGLGSDECRETALGGSTQKSSTVRGGQNGDCGIVYNRVKENCKVKNVGRVLRRRLGIKTGDEKESNKAEILKKDRNTGCYGSENGRDVDVQVGVSGETIDAEGLRSDDKVIPEVNDMQKISFDLNDEIMPMTGYGNDFVENNVEIKESVGSINDEGGETGKDENERNGRVNGEDNGGDGVVKKSMKDDFKVKNVGRVLRSRIKSESKKETYKTEIDVKGRTRVFDGSENKGDVDGQITQTDLSPDFLKENLEIKESDGRINNEYVKSGLDENKRKRSRVDGEELGDDGAVKRIVKEDC